MDDTRFLATWDDTGNVGVVYLTKAELKELATGTTFDKGEYIASKLLNIVSFASCVLSEARREILIETNELVFKLRLRFGICCMASEGGIVPQINEDASVLGMYNIFS